MRKHLIVLALSMLYVITFAQRNDSILTKSEFHSTVSKLSKDIKSIEKSNTDLLRINSVYKKEISNLKEQIKVANSNIHLIADSLHISVIKISANKEETKNQIETINQTITKQELYWIIGILFVALLCLLVFVILGNKLSLNTRNFDSQIENTNRAIQNEANKLDAKLIEILQSQLVLLKEERKIKDKKVSEPDHKLPLKVGNEIYRMRLRINSMKSEERALTPLKKSLERLEDEFNEAGYEIIDMINKPYNDGLSVEAKFIPSDDLKPGERIITKVIKPQINFNQESKQMAEIEVSIGS